MKSESEGQEPAFVNKAPEFINIFDNRFQFHWAPIGNLAELLSRGIESGKFAARVGLKLSGGTGARLSEVYLTQSPQRVWDFGHGIDERIAIVVDVPQKGKVPIRINPRKFVGLVFVDQITPVGWKDVLDLYPYQEDGAIINKRVERIKSSLEDTPGGKLLPVYGTSGGLYLPKRMSHQEIVEMLRRKSQAE